MKLLTAELRKQIPALYSQEKVNPANVICKFFCPWSNWTWFATEGEEQEGDFLFFGYVIGMEEEWGYFVLSELESVSGPGGLMIERDLYFKQGTFEEVIATFRKEHGQ